MRLGILAVACILSMGCAQTATMRKWQPAPFDMSQRRLGVVNTYSSREQAGRTLDTLQARLSASGVSVVSQQELRRATQYPITFADGGANTRVALEAARRMGLDGLLVTKVSFVERDGSEYGSKFLRFGDPTITAAVQYELVDVRSGNVLDRSTVLADYFQGEIDSRSEPKVLAKLAEESGVKLSHVLASHETEIQAPLASSAFGIAAGELGQGNQAAMNGDWNQASVHWRAAAQSDPENDAALYNLGLAYEALGHLDQARRLMESALAINEAVDYERALERVRRNQEDLRMSQAQRSRTTFARGPATPTFQTAGRPPNSQPVRSAASMSAQPGRVVQHGPER